jgi:hypothetical protein
MSPTPALTALDPADARLAHTSSVPASLLLAELPPPAPQQPMLPLSTDALAAPATEARGEIDRLARQLIAALFEAIAGRRPPTQLRAWVAAGVYELADELARGGAGAGMTIRSVRLQTPGPKVIEASVHLRQAGRSRAAAIQLTFTDHHWQVTTLELGLSRSGPTVTDLELLPRAARARRVASDPGVGIVAGGVALASHLAALVGS